jgi:hypothetical protein
MLWKGVLSQEGGHSLSVFIEGAHSIHQPPGCISSATIIPDAWINELVLLASNTIYNPMALG